MKRLSISCLILFLATVTQAGETKITGFVDASYSYNSSEKNGEFSVDQVEVDIIHRASERSLLRADIEVIKDGEDFLAQIEQGFMTYTLPHTWDFTFGRFNAPIGFEMLDPMDMYQYSHSMVFNYGVPINLTGASLAKDFGPGFDIVGHVSNGWEANAMAGNNVTWGGRLGYGQGGFGGGVSYVSGKEETEEEDEMAEPVPFKRNVFDVDLSFATGAWVFGGEFNLGKVTTTVDQDWTAFLVMTHVKFSSRAGFTLRYDGFDDKGGWNFPEVAGEPQNIQSLTFCPTFMLDENFRALLELRLYKSDRNGFTDRDDLPTDSNTSVAFEMTYSW